MAPVPWVCGDHLAPPADHHPIHVAFDNHLAVRVAHRHRVVVVLKARQRQGGRGGGALAAGVEGDGRQRNEGRLILTQEDFFAGRLAPQPPLQIPPAGLGQLLVELFERPHLRHRH